MATVTKPIALDESINTTEQTPRNIADVLAEELKGIADNILPPNASQIAYDNTESGLTATNVQDAIDEVISSQADVIADTMADLTKNKTAVVTDGVADFETIDGSLVKSLVVSIKPSQSGTGTPSPSNIRPISGYTQEDIFVVGKNWANPIQGNCSTNGTITSDSTRLCNSDYIPVKAGQRFTVSAISLTQKTVQVYFRIFSEKGTDNIRRSNSWTNSPLTIDIQSGEYYLQLIFRNSDNSDIEPSDANIQLELGNTATAFEPYHSKTYTTPFNQTVYGGTLDVLTGELTITHGYVDLGTLTWSLLTGQTHAFQSTGLSSVIKRPATNMTVADVICSNYPADTSDNVVAGSTAVGVSTGGTTRIYDTDYSNATAFRNAMNGVQLVYALATLQTIRLTPQKVKSLVEENHISASTGDVLECKYSMMINGDDLAQIIGGE